MESEKYEKKLNAECQGDREYELCLKKALKEALDENEKVRIFLFNVINIIDERDYD